MLNFRIGWGFVHDNDHFVVILHVKEEELNIEGDRSLWQSWLRLNCVPVSFATFQKWKNAPRLLLLPSCAPHWHHTLIAHVPISHFDFVPLS